MFEGTLGCDPQTDHESPKDVLPLYDPSIAVIEARLGCEIMERVSATIEESLGRTIFSDLAAYESAKTLLQDLSFRYAEAQGALKTLDSSTARLIADHAQEKASLKSEISRLKEQLAQKKRYTPNSTNIDYQADGIDLEGDQLRLNVRLGAPTLGVHEAGADEHVQRLKAEHALMRMKILSQKKSITELNTIVAEQQAALAELREASSRANEMGAQLESLRREYDALAGEHGALQQSAVETESTLRKVIARLSEDMDFWKEECAAEKERNGYLSEENAALAEGAAADLRAMCGKRDVLADEVAKERGDHACTQAKLAASLTALAAAEKSLLEARERLVADAGTRESMDARSEAVPEGRRPGSPQIGLLKAQLAAALQKCTLLERELAHMGGTDMSGQESPSRRPSSCATVLQEAERKAEEVVSRQPTETASPCIETEHPVILSDRSHSSACTPSGRHPCDVADFMISIAEQGSAAQKATGVCDAGTSARATECEVVRVPYFVFKTLNDIAALTGTESPPQEFCALEMPNSDVERKTAALLEALQELNVRRSEYSLSLCNGRDAPIEKRATLDNCEAQTRIRTLLNGVNRLLRDLVVEPEFKEFCDSITGLFPADQVAQTGGGIVVHDSESLALLAEIGALERAKAAAEDSVQQYDDFCCQVSQGADVPLRDNYVTNAGSTSYKEKVQLLRFRTSVAPIPPPIPSHIDNEARSVDRSIEGARRILGDRHRLLRSVAQARVAKPGQFAVPDVFQRLSAELSQAKERLGRRLEAIRDAERRRVERTLRLSRDTSGVCRRSLNGMLVSSFGTEETRPAQAHTGDGPIGSQFGASAALSAQDLTPCFTIRHSPGVLPLRTQGNERLHGPRSTSDAVVGKDPAESMDHARQTTREAGATLVAPSVAARTSAAGLERGHTELTNLELEDLLAQTDPGCKDSSSPRNDETTESLQMLMPSRFRLCAMRDKSTATSGSSISDTCVVTGAPPERSGSSACQELLSRDVALLVTHICNDYYVPGTAKASRRPANVRPSTAIADSGTWKSVIPPSGTTHGRAGLNNAPGKFEHLVDSGLQTTVALAVKPCMEDSIWPTAPESSSAVGSNDYTLIGPAAKEVAERSLRVTSVNKASSKPDIDTDIVLDEERLQLHRLSVERSLEIVATLSKDLADARVRVVAGGHSGNPFDRLRLKYEDLYASDANVNITKVLKIILRCERAEALSSEAPYPILPIQESSMSHQPDNTITTSAAPRELSRRGHFRSSGISSDVLRAASMHTFGGGSAQLFRQYPLRFQPECTPLERGSVDQARSGVTGPAAHMLVSRSGNTSIAPPVVTLFQQNSGEDYRESGCALHSGSRGNNMTSPRLFCPAEHPEVPPSATDTTGIVCSNSPRPSLVDDMPASLFTDRRACTGVQDAMPGSALEQRDLLLSCDNSTCARASDVRNEPQLQYAAQGASVSLRSYESLNNCHVDGEATTHAAPASISFARRAMTSDLREPYLQPASSRTAALSAANRRLAGSAPLLSSTPTALPRLGGQKLLVVSSISTRDKRAKD